MNSYSTEEKARIGLGVLEHGDIETFCPLASGPCDKRCVCFQKPYMTSGRTGDPKHPHVWYVYEHGCTNHMFHGVPE